MRACPECGWRVEDEFRFCPRCGAVQRAKIVEHFTGHDGLGDGDLRVSAYLTPPRHVRLSIWRRNRAESVTALDYDQARRLARFLQSVTERTPSRVRRYAHALREALTNR